MEVTTVDLRNFIDAMRQRTGVAYPLAHCQQFATGRQLLHQAQADAGVEKLAEMFDLTEQQVRWALSYVLAEQAA